MKLQLEGRARCASGRSFAKLQFESEARREGMHSWGGTPARRRLFNKQENT